MGSTDRPPTRNAAATPLPTPPTFGDFTNEAGNAPARAIGIELPIDAGADSSNCAYQRTPIEGQWTPVARRKTTSPRSKQGPNQASPPHKHAGANSHSPVAANSPRKAMSPRPEGLAFSPGSDSASRALPMHDHEQQQRPPAWPPTWSEEARSFYKIGIPGMGRADKRDFKKGPQLAARGGPGCVMHMVAA